MKLYKYTSLIVTLIILNSIHLTAQFEDKFWITGYNISGGVHPQVGYNLISFERNNEIAIDTGFFDVVLSTYVSSLSTESRLEVFTNGCRIIDGQDFENINNGDELNHPSYNYQRNCIDGLGTMNAWQSSIFLHHPLHSNKIALFHLARMLGNEINSRPDSFLYTEIEEEGGDYRVTIKNQVIAIHTEEDYEYSYGITATRHGNGRDWWIIFPKSKGAEPRFYVYLWNGVDVVLWDEYFINNKGEESSNIFDHVTISSQGDKLAALSTNSLNRIYLLEFDRSKGIFTSDQIIEIESTYTGGLCFSHSGKYLYHADFYNFSTTTTDIWQYDMEAEDIQGSKKLVVNFDFDLGTDFWDRETGVWHMTRGPNGKIYVGTTTTTTHYHVINYPELEGAAAGFEYWGLRVPKIRNFGIPLFPNYHVTAMPGTPCDTLDMGKAPYTKWNYQVRGDTVRFFDLTYYSPTEWSWDFGDGQTGEGAMPVHVYAEKGIYQVCLTASSAYGSDEFCMEIQTGTTSVREESAGVKKLEIYPNPVQEEVYISQDMLGSRYEIVSMSGQRVGLGVLETERLDVRGLQGGVYVIRVWVGGEVYVGKVVKI